MLDGGESVIKFKFCSGILNRK
eukprot:SAG31_NODE_26559_length_440_cov_0.906158_2_plen_21_part_01